MKVQQIQQNNIQRKDSKGDNKPQFKGGVDTFLRFLATNQGVGANLTDLCFMVIPRAASDARRGPEAFVETTRREASGTANHSLIGAYGLLGGSIAVMLMGIDKKYGISANSIMTAPETINILAENKARQMMNGKSQIDYLVETFSHLKAYNPTSKFADAEGFVKISRETIEEVAKIMDSSINNVENFKVWHKKTPKNSFDSVVNLITKDTGAQSKYILESLEKPLQEGGKALTSETSLQTLLEDMFKVSQTFNKEEVVNSFKEQIKNGKTIKDNAYVKKLSKFMKTRSVAGFILGSAIGMSIQPLNIYLTKLKTGSDGFVGVEGRTKDNSNGFKALKIASAGAFGGLTLATLGTGFKGFMDKMSFKGFWPTINQLKGIYGLTIMSRLLATRDKDELREALTKDTLGFLSWLVLGDIVNKLTAYALDDKKIENTVFNSSEQKAKGLWQTLKYTFKSKLKTRDEILIETLSANNIDVVKREGNDVIAKKFKEMMKDLDQLPEEIRNSAKKRLKTLNKAQFAGYLFSGLVLGLGIPNLNIYITNKLDAKRKAKQAQEN